MNGENQSEMYDAQKARDERLDKTATYLITGTTIATTIWTSAGLAADRFPALLNSSGVKWQILFAFLLAGLAAVAGAVSQSLTAGEGSKDRIKVLLLGAGTAALVASLGLAVWSTSLAFTEDGRPTLTDVSASTPDGTGVNLSFTVHADGVDRNTHLVVIASWVRNGKNDTLQPPFFTAVIRPDPSGVVEQKASLPLPRPKSSTFVRLQAYRLADTAAGTDNNPPPGASCSDQINQKTAAACLDLQIPAAVAQ